VKPKVAVKTADGQISVAQQCGDGANWIIREERNMTQFLPWPLLESQSLHHWKLVVWPFLAVQCHSNSFLAVLLLAFMARMAGESITHLS